MVEHRVGELYRNSNLITRFVFLIGVVLCNGTDHEVVKDDVDGEDKEYGCLLYTSPSPRD